MSRLKAGVFMHSLTILVGIALLWSCWAIALRRGNSAGLREAHERAEAISHAVIQGVGSFDKGASVTSLHPCKRCVYSEMLGIWRAFDASVSTVAPSPSNIVSYVYADQASFTDQFKVALPFLVGILFKNGWDYRDFLILRASAGQDLNVHGINNVGKFPDGMEGDPFGVLPVSSEGLLLKGELILIDCEVGRQKVITYLNARPFNLARQEYLLSLHLLTRLGPKWTNAVSLPSK